MPNLTTALPRKTGDLQKDYDNLYQTCVSLIDELKALLCNLDAGNVTEAGSIKAQNIDVSQAKIKDAQVQSMTADKLTAGTIDAREIDVIHITADNIDTGTLNSGLVTISNRDGDGSYMAMADNTIVLNQKNRDGTYTPRILIGRTKTDVLDGNGNPQLDGEGNVIQRYQYVFNVQNKSGTQRIYMADTGNIYMTGNITGASTIDVENNVRIGRFLTFQDDIGGGWQNAGSINVSNATMTISANNSRGITISGGPVNIQCTDFTVNGNHVAYADE